MHFPKVTDVRRIERLIDGWTSILCVQILGFLILWKVKWERESKLW